MEPWLTGLSDDWCSAPSSHASSSTSSKPNSRSSSTCSVKRNSITEKLEFTTKDLFTPSKLENVFAPPAPSPAPAPLRAGRQSSTISSRLRSRSLNSTLTPVKEISDDSKLTNESSLPSNLSTGTQKPTFIRSRRRYVSSRSQSLSDSKIPLPIEDTSLAEDFSAVDSSIIKQMTPAPKRVITRRDTSVESNDPTSPGNHNTSNLESPPKSEDSKITQDLAAELESFAKSVHATKVDTRKPSMTTRDYMQEAEKVMEFIRARKPPVSSIKIPRPESSDSSSDDESTKEEFKRPPSRKAKYYQKSTDDKRHAVHDEKTANFLKKFQESEDLELLTNASVFANPPPVDNQAAEEASLIALPADDEFSEEGSIIIQRTIPKDHLENDQSYSSEPAGMRILNEHHQNENHPNFQTDIHGSNHINSDTGPPTVVTASSTASAQRGMISSGTVSIPDRVGAMTFDREKQTWVKETQKAKEIRPLDISPPGKGANRDASEMDPFADIPDLSFDEGQEARLEKEPAVPAVQEIIAAEVVAPQIPEKVNRSEPLEDKPVQTQANSFRKSSLKSKPMKRTEKQQRSSSKDSKISEHEERLAKGLPSQDIYDKGKQQPRAVTIAFSSPIAYEIPLPSPPSMSDIERDDPDYLPLDAEGSTIANSPAKSIPEHEYITDSETEPSPHRSNLENLRRWYLKLGSINQKRRVSRIVEEEDEGYDTNDNKEYHEDRREMSMVHIPNEDKENYEDNREMSMVHIKHQELTPMPERHVGSVSKNNQSSILSLTPLSEFTLHQVDKINHPEESFIAPRVNSKTLRQAHGSHALLEDALVKAITDAEPTELFWEQLKKLSLQRSGLSSLYGLKDYCSALQSLNVANNKISHLTDMPISLRTLNISSNMINDLTSWNHLHNLQCVDVSGNHLESLECFTGLIHLRKLNASDNRIRKLDDVLELSGLISLDLSGNDIAEVDFYDNDLSSLEQLHLGSNNLVQVKYLDRLEGLKYADFTENVLESFEIVQGKTSRLETLCLAKNSLTTVDLTTFPRLQRLNIDENIITEIIGLAEAEYLTVLSIRAQALEEPSNLINDILDTPHDLTEIYLSSNALTGRGLQLPTKPNYTLRCLEMASCGIKDIPPSFGEHFPNMRVLNLNFNALSTNDIGTLRGMTKLRTLLLAKNRIKKMRRTCLTLEKFENLRRLDVRDNPLTVGFYDPLKDSQFGADGAKARSDYRLPERMVDADKQWISVMDETTCARRAITQLMIAQGCNNIEELDGLAFDRDRILSEKYTWNSMVTKGVLVSYG